MQAVPIPEHGHVSSSLRKRRKVVAPSISSRALSLTRVLHAVSVFVGEPALPLVRALRGSRPHFIEEKTVQEIIHNMPDLFERAKEILGDKTVRISPHRVATERKILSAYLDKYGEQKEIHAELLLFNDPEFHLRCMAKGLDYIFFQTRSFRPNFTAQSIIRGDPFEVVEKKLRRTKKRDIPQLSWYAAFRGDIDILRLLVDKGFEVNCETMRAACLGGHIDVIEYLNERGLCLKHECLIGAAMTGKIDVVKLLVERGVPYTRDTIDSACAYGGHVSVVGYLMETNPTLVPKRLDVRAARSGNIELLRFLLTKGFTWDTSTLKVAVGHGHLHVVKYLLSGRDAPVCPRDKDTFVCLRNKPIHCMELVRFVLNDERFSRYVNVSTLLNSLWRDGPADLTAECIIRHGLEMEDMDRILNLKRNDVLRLVMKNRYVARIYPYQWSELLARTLREGNDDAFHIIRRRVGLDFEHLKSQYHRYAFIGKRGSDLLDSLGCYVDH